jgi:DNA-binding response OmpR family regulator
MRARRTALVVDDSEIHRYFLRALLEPEGFDVDEAASVREAVRRARLRAPELVCVDWGLPGESGEALCRLLRANRATRAAAIVMFSGEDIAALDRRARAAGADRFVEKTDDGSRILAAVRAVLAARAG